MHHARRRATPKPAAGMPKNWGDAVVGRLGGGHAHERILTEDEALSSPSRTFPVAPGAHDGAATALISLDSLPREARSVHCYVGSFPS